MKKVSILEQNSDIEKSPWKSHRQYEEQLSQETTRALTELFVLISTQWLGLPGEFQKAKKKYKLDKDIKIDPSTGKPLSDSMWKKLGDNLTQAFNYIFGDRAVENITDKAFNLGKILRKLTPKRRAVASLKKLKLGKKYEPKNDKDKIVYTLGRQRAGTYIKNLSDTARKRVEVVITSAIQNKRTAEELQLDLFESLSEVNKDWRMIALTELSANQTDSQLIDMLSENKNKPLLVMGLSAPGACKYCNKLINNKVLLLLSESPVGGGDQVEYNGKNYTAIWPGKNNIGLKASAWKATIPMHPRCRCGYARYYEYLSDYYKELEKLAFNF